MASKSATYEVQLMRDGRWSTQSCIDTEQTATAAARRYMMDAHCEGARVIHSWTRPDGHIIEREVFVQTRRVSDDGPVHINDIDSAPAICAEPDDFFSPASRAVINRILRNYLEKVFVTPTELLHNYRELKRVQDKDNLAMAALERIASLQTHGGPEARTRRDDLFKLVDRLSARARRAEALPLPKLGDDFGAVLTAVSRVRDDSPDYLARVVLSRDLVSTRHWLGKLERLTKLAETESELHALALLDGVMADVLGANLVQDILGWQPSLAAAIVHLLDLADGTLAAEKSETVEATERLNHLLQTGKLPESRDVLIDRAMRQLRSTNALYRTDPARERDGFVTVLNRLLTPGGLLFGADGAEALTLRATRMVEEGGNAGRRAAIAYTFNAMPDKAFGLVYLCELARSEFARGHEADIEEQARRVLKCEFLNDLCLRTLSAKDRMARATLAHGCVRASVLPAALRDRLDERIDAILERFLVDEQIIEKLDHHDSLLHDRALRLVQFAAAGLLPEGHAKSRARERILALLRSPNFDAHFVDGVADPAQAQKMLRDFHHLLVRAGFGP